MPRHYTPEEAAERFWSKVDKDGPLPDLVPHLGQCWIWKPPLSVLGYGSFKDGGYNYRAHRYAWELSEGRIEEGIHLHHRCHNRACVRPAHLQPLSPAHHLALERQEGTRHF